MNRPFDPELGVTLEFLSPNEALVVNYDTYAGRIYRDGSGSRFFVCPFPGNEETLFESLSGGLVKVHQMCPSFSDRVVWLRGHSSTLIGGYKKDGAR